MEPAKLLQHFGVVGIRLKHPHICVFGGIVLNPGVNTEPLLRGARTYVFLLLVNMADLKPYVFLGQRSRRVRDDIAETL